jgi:hypothetical protein
MSTATDAPAGNVASEMAAQPTLLEQIEELQREFDQRANIYPRMIQEMRITPAVAARRTVRLQAAIATLKRLRHQHDETAA